MGDLDSQYNLNGEVLNVNVVANPCGLIAKYFFNDRFKLETDAGEQIAIDETNIAHSVDRNSKFKAAQVESGSYEDVQWLNVTDEHVMVWFQMESFPNFIKLWGHIDSELKEGETYRLTIENKYDVSAFEGKKFVYLSEVNDFGGTNKFMAVSFLFMAGVVVFIMIVFVFLYFARLKKGDIYSTDNLEW